MNYKSLRKWQKRLRSARVGADTLARALLTQQAWVDRVQRSRVRLIVWWNQLLTTSWPLVAGIGIAVLGAGAIAYFFGPHRGLGDAYVPNLVASIMELSIGAALAALFIRAHYARRVARRRNSTLILLGRPLTELLSLLQAMYVEATEQPPQVLPGSPGELIDAWAGRIGHLDLTAEPSVATSVGARYARWMDHLEAELPRLSDRLSSVADRRAAVLDEEFLTPLSELEVDRLWELLQMLPELASQFQPPAQTLTPYLGFLSHGGPHVADLARKLKDIYAAFNRRTDEPLEIDEVYWVDAIAPFWGHSALDG